MGLDIDCSDWVKLGKIGELDRIDRNWTATSSLGNSVGQEYSMDCEPMLSGPTYGEFNFIKSSAKNYGCEKLTNTMTRDWVAHCLHCLLFLTMGFRMDARHTMTNKRP